MRNQKGMASIVAVGIIMILVTLIALGFARLMDRASQNSLARQSSSVANYAAQSAINDVATYIKTNPAAYSSNCVGSSSLIGSSTNPGPFYNDANLDGTSDRNVQYTCLLLNQTPADLVYQALPSTESRVIKMTTSAYPGSLDKIMVSWKPTDSQITGFPTNANNFLDESTWNSAANNYIPILRATLYPIPAGGSLANVQADSRTVFLYPEAAAGTVPAVNYSAISDGSIIPVHCTTNIANGDFTGTADDTCNIIFNNLTTAASPDPISYFYLRLTPIYGTADLKIKANDQWGQSLNFIGVQAIVDATAKAAGVAKRLQARLDIGGIGQSYDGNISPNTHSAPEYSVRSANAICKRFLDYTSYYSYVTSDANDQVCHFNPLVVTKAPTLTLKITGNDGNDNGVTRDSSDATPGGSGYNGVVYINSAATISWVSTDAAYNCNASGGWSGNKNDISSWNNVTGTGSQSFSGISNYTTYTMACSGPGGTTSPKTVTAWPPPAVSISGPSSYQAGNSYTINWSARNSTKCTISSSGNEPWNQTYNGLSPTGASDSKSFGTNWNDDSTKTYSIVCSDPSGRQSSTATWTVGRGGGYGTGIQPPSCTADTQVQDQGDGTAQFSWTGNCPSISPGSGSYYLYSTTDNDPSVNGYVGPNGGPYSTGIRSVAYGNQRFCLGIRASAGVWGQLVDSGCNSVTVQPPVITVHASTVGNGSAPGEGIDTGYSGTFYFNSHTGAQSCHDGLHNFIFCISWNATETNGHVDYCNALGGTYYDYNSNGNAPDTWWNTTAGWNYNPGSDVSTTISCHSATFPNASTNVIVDKAPFSISGGLGSHFPQNCGANQFGTWPNCSCDPGYTGYPTCVPIPTQGGGGGGGNQGGGGGGGSPPPQYCPVGWRGTYPNCTPVIGCFTAGTFVATLNGSRPIEDIHVGDWVESYDTSTGKMVSAQVAKTFMHQSQPTLWIVTTGGSVTTTAIHPFWDGRGWVEAGDLVAGKSYIQDSNGKLEKVLLTMQGAYQTVYNLEVNNINHDYFANGYLVHNKFPPE